MLSDIWERVKSTVTEGIGWVGDTWAIKTISGAVRPIVAPLVDFLGEELAEYLTVLGDIVDSILSLVLTPIRRAWAPLGSRLGGLMEQLRGLASSVYDGFRKVMLVHLPRLRSWAARLVSSAVGAVQVGLNALSRWVAGRVSDLWRGIDGLRRWVVDSVLRPLGERIVGLTRWATQRVSDLWREVSALRKWIVEEVLTPLWNTVTGLVDFVYGRVLFAVRLIELIYTTLQALVRYGPGRLMLLMLPGGLGRLAADLVRSTEGSVADTVAALDDAADRWMRL